MPEFVTGTLIAGIAIAVLVLEIPALALWRRRNGVPERWLRLVSAALPGLFLLLALNAALRDQGVVIIALWLACALPAHLLDIKLRPP